MDVQGSNWLDGNLTRGITITVYSKVQTAQADGRQVTWAERNPVAELLSDRLFLIALRRFIKGIRERAALVLACIRVIPSALKPSFKALWQVIESPRCCGTCASEGTTSLRSKHRCALP